MVLATADVPGAPSSTRTRRKTRASQGHGCRPACPLDRASKEIHMATRQTVRGRRIASIPDSHEPRIRAGPRQRPHGADAASLPASAETDDAIVQLGHAPRAPGPPPGAVVLRRPAHEIALPTQRRTPLDLPPLRPARLCARKKSRSTVQLHDLGVGPGSGSCPGRRLTEPAPISSERWLPCASR